MVNGHPAIGYSVLDDFTFVFSLKYVRATDADGTSWGTPLAVAASGQSPSLVVVDGRPAMGYCDQINAILYYVRASDASGTAWGTPVTLASGFLSNYASLAVVAGNPAIGYFHANNSDLQYVRATDASGTTWGAPVTFDSAGGVGLFASLAAVNGNPAISYYDRDSGTLKWATTAPRATSPVVTTPTSASVLATSATLGGDVTADGGSAITERGVVYSLTATNADPLISGTGVTKVTAAGTTGVFTAPITGLTASSGYSFKAYATNGIGTTYTSVGTFTTAAVPSVLYAEDSIRNRTNSGTGWAGGWTVPLNIAPGLTYPGLSTDGGSVSAMPAQTFRSLSTPQTTGIVWVSALVTGGGYANIGLFSGGQEKLTAGVIYNGSGPGPFYGTFEVAGAGQRFDYSAVPVDGATHMVLMAINLDANQFLMWVDPNLAALGAPAIVRTASFNTGSYDFDRIRLEVTGSARVDEVRVGSDLASIHNVVPPVNNAPYDIVVSPSSIAENNAPGATVGTVLALDADAEDMHTVAMVSGAGDTDNGAFTLTGNTLKLNASADFETKSSYSIRLRVTESNVNPVSVIPGGREPRRVDAGGLSFERQVTIAITDVVVPQVITFAALSGKTFGDPAFTVSATGGASGQPVVFSIFSGPATIAGDTVTITGAGLVRVRATQAGSPIGEFGAAAAVTQSFTVARAAQVITFGALAGKAFGDADFTVSATGGASGQPVTFGISGPATIAGNTVTITGVGDVTVTASQAGNTNYLAAVSVPQTFTVGKAAQTITFAPAATALITDSVTLTATGGASGNAVTFSFVSGPGSLAGETLTFTGTGTVVVRASQAGNANYNAAADVDASITVSAPSGPPAVDDAVTVSSGSSVLYPLANDGNPAATIVSVSIPSVIIDGRTLIVPAGFSGTFSYTTSDGHTATVTVNTAAPDLAPQRFSGLLYDSSGAIVGRARTSRTVSGINIFIAQIGSATGKSVFTFPAAGNVATGISTALGSVSATLAADGHLLIAMSGGVTGDLRPTVLTASPAVYNVGLGALLPAVKGAGFGTARISSIGAGKVLVKMPDGRAFSAITELSDNGSFSFYGRQASTAPFGYVGGELIFANLAKTDVTGELEWKRPAQSLGIDRAAVNSIVVANGCVANGTFGFPDGPATLTFSGGNYATPTAYAVNVSGAAVMPFLPTLRYWTPVQSGQTFKVLFRQPGRTIDSTGTGMYFQKSHTALGFFLGNAFGGKVELKQP